MAEAQNTLSLSVRARAGLQILNHAIYYVAGEHVAGEHRDEAELLARLDAGALMWEARESILRRAAKQRMPHLRRLYREAMQIVWRNPQAGVQ